MKRLYIRDNNPGWRIRGLKFFIRASAGYLFYVIIFTLYCILSYTPPLQYGIREPPEFEAFVLGIFLLLLAPCVITLMIFVHTIVDMLRLKHFLIIRNRAIFFLTCIFLCVVSSIIVTFFSRKGCCPLWQYKIIITGYNIGLFMFLLISYLPKGEFGGGAREFGVRPLDEMNES